MLQRYGGPAFKNTHEVGRAEQPPDKAQLFFVGTAGQQWAAAHHLCKDAAHAPEFKKEGEARSTRAVLAPKKEDAPFETKPQAYHMSMSPE